MASIRSVPRAVKAIALLGEKYEPVPIMGRLGGTAIAVYLSSIHALGAADYSPCGLPRTAKK
jgi:hypothetical protein